jgi:hypothetical protein
MKQRRAVRRAAVVEAQVRKAGGKLTTTTASLMTSLNFA